MAHKTCSNLCIHLEGSSGAPGPKCVLGLNVVQCYTCERYFPIDAPYIIGKNRCICCNERLRKKSRKGSGRSEIIDRFEKLGMIKRY